LFRQLVRLRPCERDVLAALAVILLAPFLIHGPELLGLVSCDPLARASRLTEALSTAPHFLLSGCVIDSNDGFTLQALGHLSAEDWLSGRLPWWNPYSGAGMPLAAEMQPASFYLPFILLLHFADGVLYIKIVTQLLAGLGMFMCLRQLRASAGAAVLGALMFEFNGSFAWYGDTTILPVPFLPLLIAGIDRAREAALPPVAGGRWPVAGGRWVIALAIALSLLAGFPETAAFDGMLAFLWACMAALSLPRVGLVRFWTQALFGGLTGLALAAPALVSFIDYLGHGFVPFHDAASFGRVKFGLVQGQGAALILPTMFGPPYQDRAVFGWGFIGGFVGAAPVFMGLLALCSRRECLAVRLLLAGWILFWTAVVLGDPITQAVWHGIPIIRQGAAIRYIMPSLSFAWALLAARGWDLWRAGVVRARLAGAAFGVIAAAAATDCAQQGRLSIEYGLPTLLWALVLGIGLTWLLSRPYSAAGRVMVAALLIADVAFSFAMPISAADVPASVDRAPIDYLLAQPGFFRSYAIGNLLLPNSGAFFQTPTIQSESIPRPIIWDEYAPALDGRVVSEFPLATTQLHEQAAILAEHRTAFAAAAVAYILVPRQNDPMPGLHDAAFQPVFEDNVARIYRMAGAAPYFEVAGGPCVLRVFTREKLDAVCKRPATLLRRELYYPGWRVERDGRAAQMQRAGKVFQSMELPEGASHIRWHYVPPFSGLIAALFVAGCAGFAGMVGLSFWSGTRWNAPVHASLISSRAARRRHEPDTDGTWNAGLILDRAKKLPPESEENPKPPGGI